MVTFKEFSHRLTQITQIKIKLPIRKGLSSTDDGLKR